MQAQPHKLHSGLSLGYKLDMGSMPTADNLLKMQETEQPVELQTARTNLYSLNDQKDLLRDGRASTRLEDDYNFQQLSKLELTSARRR